MCCDQLYVAESSGDVTHPISTDRSSWLSVNFMPTWKVKKLPKHGILAQKALFKVVINYKMFSKTMIKNIYQIVTKIQELPTASDHECQALFVCSGVQNTCMPLRHFKITYIAIMRKLTYIIKQRHSLRCS